MTIELPNNNGEMFEESEVFGTQAFLEAILIEFPGIGNRFGKNDGIHIAMGTLHQMCSDAIRSSDFDLVKRVFQFLERVVTKPKVDSEIENAVAISFLTPTELTDSPNGKTALDMLPERFRRIILEPRV